ncbi:MAG TPA: HD domain-containing protein [Candidatus Limnocylindrales bacterium]|nr:HD domain-containing protein [Candidatus Limnocylindrales bacterium]
MLPNPVRVPQLLPIRLLQRYAVDKYTYVVMSTPVDLPRLVLLAQGFAMCAHRNQRRKYEDLPYVVHCERVARTVAEYTDDANVIAAAFMHEVLEDTDVTAEEMRRVFGDAITDLVLEVTDVSRPSDGKRQVRKDKDREHLAKSSAGGATIKLADLIDNCVSIAEHDKGFAVVYLREADALLIVLKHGDERLWERTRNTLADATEQLDSSG